MLFEKTGKAILQDIKAMLPGSGRSIVIETTDRRPTDITRSLDPSKIDNIFKLANSGSVVNQSLLASEILEKNWDIISAVQTRCLAVDGIQWTIEPGGDSPADKKTAEELEAALGNTGSEEDDLASFDEFKADLLSALLPGFAVSEIAWISGGGLAGFFFVPQCHFTFENGSRPQLITKEFPKGMDLPRYKFVIHKMHKRGGSIERGGLIRTLAWLHCFQNINFKDLVGFIERYGMPFAMAKVEKEAWDSDRNKIKQLIRNFGPSGGGVFTKAVELQLVEASRTTGDVYFKLLEYTGKAITRVILGQTATSGDGGGFSKDGAQDAVRQDILEGDCKALANTINKQLIKPWHAFNHPSAACPKFVLHCEPPEDTKQVAETVKTLYEGGFEADEKEMSEKFGMKLKRRTQEGASTANVPTQKTEKKDSIAMSENASEEITYPEKYEKIFAKFADVIEKYLDDPDALAEFADQLDTEPEKFFAMFAGDDDSLEDLLEEDINEAIKQAKKEINDARRP